MDSKYYPAEYSLKAFNCPICGVYSNQTWKEVYFYNGRLELSEDTLFAFCAHCHEKSIWFNNKMIYPYSGNVPLPNQDLPQDILVDYNEARDILSKSPRGSAALLRLSIQKLCVYLGEKGKDLNGDIAKLVSKGLPIKIQQSLDIVRVVGNQAVHPGQLDIKDNHNIAINLFGLLNIIAEVMITQPKHIEQLYGTLPEAQKEAINLRDNQ